LKFDYARSIAKAAIEAFTNGDVDSAWLVYNEFRSVISQRVVTQQLLPIQRQDIEASAAATPGTAAGGGGTTEYLFEPEPKQMFNRLLPLHVEVQVFRALLESNAAFYAAQMTAMDAATRNSADMIEALTLYMNKVRQAAITREIIEVVSGAGAL
jgi:F-type H+-transporting ATPase subunit gamma